MDAKRQRVTATESPAEPTMEIQRQLKKLLELMRIQETIHALSMDEKDQMSRSFVCLSLGMAVVSEAATDMLKLILAAHARTDPAPADTAQQVEKALKLMVGECPKLMQGTPEQLVATNKAMVEFASEQWGDIAKQF